MLSQLGDVFKSLHQYQVKYVVIGGIAVVLHGVPRATFDLDILIESTPDNAQKLLEALFNARIGTALLTNVEKLLANEITIFNDRIRIDVQTKTPGIEFETAWQSKETMTYQNQVFYVVSKYDLIASKQAAGRPVDLEDIKLLTLDDETK